MTDLLPFSEDILDEYQVGCLNKAFWRKCCFCSSALHSSTDCSASPDPHTTHPQKLRKSPGKNQDIHFEYFSLVLTWMYQFLFLRLCRPSLSVISAAFIALGRSCLLAKMRRTASLNSSSANIRISSSLASPILSLTNDILKYKQISSWHTLSYLKVVVGVLSFNCLIYFPY